MSTTASPMAGPIFQQWKIELAEAYKANDAEMIQSVLFRLSAATKACSDIRLIADTLFDNANSGFGDTAWMGGIERIRALTTKDGVKVVKVDPTEQF